MDLEATGCKVFYTSADADVLIVQPVAQRQEMVINTLALLWYFVIIAMM